MGGYDLNELIDMSLLTYPWTFDLLAYALRSHSTSLRELRVGQMSTQEDLNNFDLHKYPKLEVFQVCTSCIPTADRAAQLWLTPKLKQLVLECSSDDCQLGQCFSFGEREVRWLEQLAAIAAREIQIAKVGLETIEVLYEIDDYERKYEVQGVRQMEELFLRTTELIATYGLEFVYPVEAFRSLGIAADEGSGDEESGDGASGDGESDD